MTQPTMIVIQGDVLAMPALGRGNHSWRTTSV